MAWDLGVGTEDDVLTDGRAYLRAIGGQFRAEYVKLSHLGFWSGRTGGLALTGTDRPDVGAIGSDLSDEPGDSAGSHLLQDVSVEPAGNLPAQSGGATLAYSVPGLNYISSNLSNVTVANNAFGLFASGANGLQISDSSFTDNLFGGVVLHRYVTNGVINTTTSSRNGGDGFTLSRATSSIAISESTAERNAGSGFRLAGRPLADGPSAVGASLRSYGNNSVSNSVATNNGHYGIEVLGGFNIGLNNNRIDGHEMGIMINGPARQISVTGNTLRNSARHGVALVNGVSDATVTGNVVEESSTGIYLRDSSGQVTGNTVQSAGSHGVSLVGEVGGSDVSFNILAGGGPSALDTMRAEGNVATSTNNADGWHDTSPWYYSLRKLLQPMTALWVAIAGLLAISAVRNRRIGRGVMGHPYAHQTIGEARRDVPKVESAVPSEWRQEVMAQ